MILTTVAKDGVTFYLERYLGNYKMIRKEGRYVHTDFLGDIKQEEAESKFNIFINN